MPSSDVAYTTRGGEDFGGYLSEPGGNQPAPGILVITAIFGVDEEMKQLADAWASDGFVVSMPDIFWRVMPGPTADMDKAFERMNAFDPEQGMLDIEDLVQDLKARPRCNGKVAVLGFCFGGRYAHLAAARLGVDAVGAYHGTAIAPHLDEVGAVRCPVSFHFGDEDPVVPMDQVDAIKAAYASHANADIVVHAGATHNFSMPEKPGYNADVAAASRDAVLACFRSM